MDAREFYFAVDSHEDLEWIGSKINSKGVVCAYVGCPRLGYKTEVEESAIKGSIWETLLSIMLGKRTGKIMTHVTRIVGYYSQLENWNPSKIAELHDRHLGEYVVPEAPAAPAAVAA